MVLILIGLSTSVKEDYYDNGNNVNPRKDFVISTNTIHARYSVNNINNLGLDNGNAVPLSEAAKRLNNIIKTKKISSQPIVGFDWHQEKTGLASLISLDNTLKVFYFTKLTTI